MEPIKLQDGTELVPLEQKEKEELEKQLAEVLQKFDATYLPVVKEEKTLSSVSYKASLFLLKKQKGEIISPIQPNGSEETPQAN